MEQKSQLEMVAEFTKGCEIEIPANRTDFEKFDKKEECYDTIPENVRALRRKLLWEEFQEYIEAETNDDFVGVADGLADMLYIINGTALLYGIPLDKVFKEVHRSNMTKFVNGKVIRREDGKILKPEGYQPPNIKQILKDNS